MVTIPHFDDHLERLQRRGSGRLSKHADTGQKLEELAKTVGVLKEAVEILIRHARVGPDWENAFEVSHANADAFGNVRITHDLGYKPEHFVVVDRFSLVAAPANYGNLRYRAGISDEKTATFQLDTNAQTAGNAMVFTVIPHPNTHIPTREVR